MNDPMQLITDQMPELMASLTRQYIEKKDFTERSKIRLKMKSALDLIAIDTEYPVLPQKKTLDQEQPSRQEYLLTSQDDRLMMQEESTDIGETNSRSIAPIPGAI